MRLLANQNQKFPNAPATVMIAIIQIRSDVRLISAGKVAVYEFVDLATTERLLDVLVRPPLWTDTV